VGGGAGSKRDLRAGRPERRSVIAGPAIVGIAGGHTRINHPGGSAEASTSHPSSHRRANEEVLNAMALTDASRALEPSTAPAQIGMGRSDAPRADVNERSGWFAGRPAPILGLEAHSSLQHQRPDPLLVKIFSRLRGGLPVPARRDGPMNISAQPRIRQKEEYRRA